MEDAPIINWKNAEWLNASEASALDKKIQLSTDQEVNKKTGQTKWERYKWVVNGSPGDLAYIRKTLLEIDHNYQRHAKNARVLKLAKRWNWLACGVLIVSKRAGRYYVVDGQHRLMAAMKRADIDSLPCLIFESAEMRDEAVAFRDANKERRPITTFEQWNANLVAGDEATLFAHSIITSAGRTPSEAAGHSTVRCLSAIVSAARSNREELVRVWPLAVQVCDGNPLHERVFGALMYLECNLADEQSLTEKRWSDKLFKIGYKGVHEAASRAAVFYAKGGPKFWAIGVMQELNKGIRKDALSLRRE